jgi:hypothetical protein
MTDGVKREDADLDRARAERTVAMIRGEGGRAADGGATPVGPAREPV